MITTSKKPPRRVRRGAVFDWNHLGRQVEISLPKSTYKICIDGIIEFGRHEIQFRWELVCTAHRTHIQTEAAIHQQGSLRLKSKESVWQNTHGRRDDILSVCESKIT